MEIRGYKRIKKKDIKKWFKGSNLILYVLILLLMFAFIAFAYKTIIGMNNDNADSEQNEQSETDEDINEATKEEATTYIAKNQSYKIRINVSKNIAVISSIDGSADSGSTVRAFYVATNSDIKTGSTVISEKAEWRKLDNGGYAHYSTRLENSEYMCSTAYFTKRTGNMNIEEYNKLSTSVTYGSIFMAPADAKWIYNNCGVNTIVEILSDFDLPEDVNLPEFTKYNYIDKLEE